MHECGALRCAQTSSFTDKADDKMYEASAEGGKLLLDPETTWSTVGGYHFRTFGNDTTVARSRQAQEADPCA